MSIGPEKRILKLKQKIMALGPIHPGRITKQFNVCGAAGCRCKDPENPRKHGPYYYLSFTFAGKGRTVFVPKAHVAEMKRRTERFVKLKALYQQLIEANMEWAQADVLRRDRA